MAVYAQAVLPSGRAIRVLHIGTKQFRLAVDKVGARKDLSSHAGSLALAHELLQQNFAGITPPLEWKFVAGEDQQLTEIPDINAMLDGVTEDQWIKPTQLELIVDGGPRSLDVLLDDVTDYQAALEVVQRMTSPSPADRERAGFLRGTMRRVSTS